MRKLLPYLGVSLTALVMVWSSRAAAQDQFKDLDPKHWAYEAVTELQQKGILLGYPDGYFKGKRTLTRYEFAIALKRVLDNVSKEIANVPANATPGPPGPAGPQGEVGPQGPPGMTPEEVENLRKLTDEFKDELKSLGASVKDINTRLDALARDVASINNRLDHMIHWSADLFFGERTDLSRDSFVDYSGALRNGSNTLFGAANVVHDVMLTAKGNVGNGIKANIGIDIGNYESYRGFTYSAAAIAQSALVGGGSSFAGSSTAQETIQPYIANVEIPLGGPKSNTVLTLGRYGQQVTALTYSRPDLDTYFDVPWLDDGNYVQDGFRVKSKLGSVDAQIWVASNGTVVDSNGNSFNQPLFGAIDRGSNVFAGARPSLRTAIGFPGGIDVFGDQLPANQAMGLGFGLPVYRYGGFGFNIIYLSTNITTGLPFNSEVIYDANFKLRQLGHFNAYAEWAKSVTQLNISTSDGQSNDANNAYIANVGYASGPIDVKAGYSYIDPNFSAPGAWDKIGPWYNPVNVAGPFVNLAYKINDAIKIKLGGEFLNGARNRSFLSTHDDVDRATAGVIYKLNRHVGLTADYEGDFIRVSGGNKPLAQFITLGANAHLTGNMVLKLAYQLLSYNALDGFSGDTSNANVLTTQVALHF